ncbi:hypothetical protein COW99_00475 [Candidatus Roizmanbacteria bacterium CG22_combo_CG10-13_8_21_14_all_38_20]|uniref:Methyltransferase type 11 domain-containing protein n=1 Tax=Candidatus Roizmanbacteria bacterium CG22_combo_CG10-13_8_21_14_all_38_20 TaxID=1974862 RepID=A0A2H0BWT4_9BACT|nr:MAG: hypothetical protein COW99_00475 [Candidatus Roizmanbacteria bacterium CG22_combo_CG10-13_8_21_14_all_38_20]
MDKLFEKIEQFQAPSTILFRSIELKLLKQHLAKITKPNARILDLGCGEGLTAAIVFSRKLDIGLDNHKFFAKLAKESGVYKKVIIGDARKIPLPNKSVDLVFSNCVIEHIGQIDKVFSEVHRVLKPGGKFVFTTPSHNFYKYSIFSKLGLKYISKIYGKLRDKKYSHFNTHSIEEWKNILAKHKLMVDKGYYYITKQEAELWDILLYFRIYKGYFKNLIYSYYKNAKKTDDKGATVCIIAKK